MGFTGFVKHPPRESTSAIIDMKIDWVDFLIPLKVPVSYVRERK